MIASCILRNIYFKWSRSICSICSHDNILSLCTAMYQSVCIHALESQLKMATRITDFVKPTHKRSTKRNVEPMYMRSKQIAMGDDLSYQNNQNSAPNAWRTSHGEGGGDKVNFEVWHFVVIIQVPLRVSRSV